MRPIYVRCDGAGLTAPVHLSAAAAGAGAARLLFFPFFSFTIKAPVTPYQIDGMDGNRIKLNVRFLCTLNIWRIRSGTIGGSRPNNNNGQEFILLISVR